MKNDSLPTLLPGDDALRFRTQWLGTPARPHVVGMQAVHVVAVDGERVTWTNGTPARGNAEAPFRHVSPRGELISLAGFAQLFASDSRAPFPAMAATTESEAIANR